ncbi:MAG: hypothetical protein JXR44_02950 [Thiotrichales bacterium]|nr:hypothetical protein [Thiotrichales bacterium]
MKKLGVFPVVLCSLLWGSPLSANAQLSPDEQQVQQVTHDRLIELALLNDEFAKRCRGTSVAKHFNQVNRLFITKYGMTANNYIQSFISRDTRAYQQQIAMAFNDQLSDKGGCEAAKDQQWDRQMADEFKRHLQQVEAANWRPQRRF